MCPEIGHGMSKNWVLVDFGRNVQGPKYHLLWCRFWRNILLVKQSKSYKIKYGGYLTLLTCGILGIFCYKKSELDIQILIETLCVDYGTLAKFQILLVSFMLDENLSEASSY